MKCSEDACVRLLLSVDIEQFVVAAVALRTRGTPRHDADHEALKGA